MAETITIGIGALTLRAELTVIASDELRDVLAHWGNWSPGEAEALRRYLVAEMSPHGLLSTEHASENGRAIGRERYEARQVLARLPEAKR